MYNYTVYIYWECMMNDSVDIKLVSHFNDAMVMRNLLQYGELSRPDLCHLCHLTPRAMQTIVKRLKNRDLIKTLKPKKGKVGQPTTPITLHGDGGYGIGIKVGRRRLSIQASNLNLQVSHRMDKTYDKYNKNMVLEYAQILLNQLYDELPFHQNKGDKIKGISCAVPAEYMDFVHQLSVQTNQTITPLIDIHAATIAEQWLHKIPSANYYYVFIGTYTTGAMVIDNIIYGHHQKTSDFGALSFRSDGKTVHEAASLIYLDRTLQKMGEKSILVNGLTGSESLNPQEFSAQTNTIINQWLEDATDHLSYVIDQLQKMMLLDHLVIETALPTAIRRKICNKMATKFDRKKTKIGIIEGSIGASARSIGAAIHPLLPYFQTNELLTTTIKERGKTV